MPRTLTRSAGKGADRYDDVDPERDRALVEACQAGDETAFEELYTRYYDRLCRLCQRRLSSTTDAEDAAQEAFARAWRALPRLEGERRFYPWLSVIANNVCTDLIRKNSRITPTDDIVLERAIPAQEGGQEASVLAGADRDLLAQAMERISPRHEEVLRLRESYEWSYQQIADAQGVQVSTIETLLFRARRALRREFIALAEGGVAAAALLGRLGSRLFRNPFGRVASKSARSTASAGSAASTGSAASAGSAVSAGAATTAGSVLTGGIAAAVAAGAIVAGSMGIVSMVRMAGGHGVPAATHRFNGARGASTVVPGPYGLTQSAPQAGAAPKSGAARRSGQAAPSSRRATTPGVPAAGVPALPAGGAGAVASLPSTSSVTGSGKHLAGSGESVIVSRVAGSAGAVVRSVGNTLGKVVAKAKTVVVAVTTPVKAVVKKVIPPVVPVPPLPGL